MEKNFSWNATAFFSDLTKRNIFAQQKRFTFCKVRGFILYMAVVRTVHGCCTNCTWPLYFLYKGHVQILNDRNIACYTLQNELLSIFKRRIVL